MNKLFGTDGIRGVVGKEPLTENTIKKIARASAYVLKNIFGLNKILVGYDTRESSSFISKILSNEFNRFGYEIFNLGVFPTGGVAYLCKKYSYLGVVISASHNPYQYNGIKFISPFGKKISEEIENKIEEVLKNFNKFNKLNISSRKKIFDFEKEARKQYINFLEGILGEVSSTENVSLKIDCANGSGCKIAYEFFKRKFKNCEFVNIKPNGRNINDGCGSTFPENLRKRLKKSQIGILFDGDCDRVIFIDEKKNIRDGDYIIGLLATEFKKNKNLKNSLVVVTVMSNLGLLKYLWSKNIKVIQCPVGDKYVSEYLETYEGNLGGEQAGHIVLYDYLPTGDGFITACEVLKIIIRNKKSLWELCNIFKKYPQTIKNIKTDKKPAIEEIFSKDWIKNLEKKIQGRIVLRYSGTEPLFRIMVEGQNKKDIVKVAGLIENRFLDYLKNYNENFSN